ncbi:MAG: hypothetical protein IT437_00170 [Phycisphaerales bacterium]|nr:hypothetical protein [Phycisphaerales bacterium]
MRRPGFTILELVIALGLVALLGGLATPALYERLAGSRLDAAGRDVAAVAAAVRADAVREGRGLELRAERHGGAWWLVSAPLDAPRDGAAATPVVTLRGELPAGVDASETLPSGSGGAPEAPAELPTGSAGDAETSVVLGVLLPDGSAWAPQVAYLVLAHAPERALEVKLNSWTGVPSVTEVPLAEPNDPAEEPVP